MKQTAVEWLILQIEEKNNGTSKLPFVIKNSFFIQPKEIEKQQQGYSEEDVKNALLDGWQLRDGDLPFPKAKKEWFKKFKK